MDDIIKKKINTRKQCNYIIINILEDLVNLAPQIRFNQLLTCINVLVYESILTTNMETLQVKDDFSLESYDTLMRVIQYLKKSHIDLYEKYFDDVKVITSYVED